MKTAYHVMLAVLSVLVATSVGAAEQKWTEYRSKADHFAITQPLAPTSEFKTEDRPGGKDVRHAYIYYPDPKSQDTLFVVQVGSKIPKDPRPDADLVQYAARNIPKDAQRPIVAGTVK